MERDCFFATVISTGERTSAFDAKWERLQNMCFP